MAPEMVLAAVLAPARVSVLLPAPVAVLVPERVSAPAPSFWIVAPPVVPARLMTRLVVSPGPV